MTTFKVEARSFSSVRDLNGIPAKTMQHLHDTYRTWVDKTNDLLSKMPTADIHTANPVYSEFRSFKATPPELMNEVRSYESFLSVLGGTGGQPAGPVLEKIQRDFGSWEGFVNELKATALASRAWVALAYDIAAQRLFLHLSDGPGSPTPWNSIPLFALNVSEHVIAADFARNRMRFVDACLSNLDWNRVAGTFESVIALKAEKLDSRR
jgi:Fe-Mn family superoxide dismutase